MPPILPAGKMGRINRSGLAGQPEHVARKLACGQDPRLDSEAGRRLATLPAGKHVGWDGLVGSGLVLVLVQEATDLHPAFASAPQWVGGESDRAHRVKFR
jgi:hypothetical protein